jgi:ubiquinone/menaquinone biosynthesis C-methylase UbiE
MSPIRTYEKFSQMIAGFRQMVLLHAAMELDVATRIGRGVTDAKSLARRCKANPRAMEILLDALCAIGFLQKSRGRYRNSPAARRFVSETSPESRKPKLRHSLQSTMAWVDLLETVAAGKPSTPHGSTRTSESTDNFIRAMDHNAREKAPPVVKACDLRGARSLLDLGGGPGTFALEFMKQHPGLEGAVFDLPATLRVTRRILKEKGYSKPPLKLIPGNFLIDPIPGQYGAILASNIMHMLSGKECAVVLKKAVRALNPGGVVIIHDFLLDRSRTSPPTAALFSVHMLVHTPGGRAYSGEEYRDMLRAAGCRSVKILRKVTNDSGVVIGRKSPRR